MQTNMTLSTAIRLGSLLRPQGFSWFFTFDDKTCALGAALEAVGHTKEHHDFMRLPQHWPELTRRMACVCGKEGGSSLYHVIQHWNDVHRIRREAIAGLLDEPGQAQREPQPQERAVTQPTEVLSCTT